MYGVMGYGTTELGGLNVGVYIMIIPGKIVLIKIDDYSSLKIRVIPYSKQDIKIKPYSKESIRIR